MLHPQFAALVPRRLRLDAGSMHLMWAQPLTRQKSWFEALVGPELASLLCLSRLLIPPLGERLPVTREAGEPAADERYEPPPREQGWDWVQRAVQELATSAPGSAREHSRLWWALREATGNPTPARLRVEWW